MNKAIYFDMDGTIADLYGQNDWLDRLIAQDETPYANASVLVNMSLLARYLNKLKAIGYTVGVISWLAKGSTKDYDKKVIKAKTEWLAKHLKSVEFDEINIVAYGTPKSTAVSITDGILFDDEEPNRKEWKGQAYNEKEIIKILKNLYENA
jgi:hypothetical protein